MLNTSLFIVLAVLSLLLPGTATAHELRPAVADVSQADTEGVALSVRVNLEAIVAGIGPEHDNTDDAEQAELYETLRALPASELQVRFERMRTDFIQMLQAEDVEGVSLEVRIETIDIPAPGDVRLPRDTLLLLIVPDSTARSGMSWQWDEQLGPLIIRNTQRESDTASDSSDIQSFTQYLKPGQRSKLFSLQQNNQNNIGSTFRDYVLIGIEHIIPKGIDHILFVIGLFLLAPALAPVLWQVSAFTLAHTVTLGLGISGYIVLPASIVEPLIALSITAICIENLFKRDVGKFRLCLVLFFGLLHGLGFAGVLGEVGLPAGQFFLSLLAFNIGVEIGQLMVLLACFALVGWWFGKKNWYRPVVTLPASTLIGAIGLFWFFQRIGMLA